MRAKNHFAIGSIVLTLEWSFPLNIPLPSLLSGLDNGSMLACLGAFSMLTCLSRHRLDCLSKLPGFGELPSKLIFLMAWDFWAWKGGSEVKSGFSGEGGTVEKSGFSGDGGTVEKSGFSGDGGTVEKFGFKGEGGTEHQFSGTRGFSWDFASLKFRDMPDKRFCATGRWSGVWKNWNRHTTRLETHNTKSGMQIA